MIKIKHPTFETELPSNGKQITYRPFLVKEEKILLLAKESKEVRDIYNAVRQVVTNCVITKGFSVDKISTFDMEYLFLRIFSKSVTNSLKIAYLDMNDNKEYQFTVDLDKVEIIKDPEHTHKFKVNDDVGVVMRYPYVSMVDRLPEQLDDIQLTIQLIKECVEKVWDNEEVLDFQEQTEEDKETFLDDLPMLGYEKMKKFFETSPHMYYKIEYTNANGKEQKIEFRSLEDFFSFS